jgi:hypothetical protein
MFADPKTALRVEHAEAMMMEAMVSPLVGSTRAPDAFLHEHGPGVATYIRRESPMNKLIGVGVTEPIDDGWLTAVERAYHAHGEPVRAEISTLAIPGTFEQLAARGYRLIGFENVLGRSLADVPPVHASVRVEPVAQESLAVFRDTLVDASACPDDTGVVVDQFSRQVIETVLDDSLLAHGVARYLAYRDGAVAGGASMRVHDGIAALTGSATLPAHRRRGVQAALLARRLADGRAAGAELAVITTAPGTQSQANVMKLGFSLLYSRALLVAAPAA